MTIHVTETDGEAGKWVFTKICEVGSSINEIPPIIDL